jgi:hypothetical protein
MGKRNWGASRAAIGLLALMGAARADEERVCVDEVRVAAMKGEKARAAKLERIAKITAGDRAESAAQDEQARKWTTAFAAAKAELAPTGRNPYFVLEPGYQLYFEGKEGGQTVALTITVLDETKKVDGVLTRVVEERETKGGHVVEISRNFFAICKRTNNVYYFGEDVDIYKDGKIAGHEGAWLAGENGATFGLAMPGSPLLGARYHQEVAPNKAMDRAEVVSLSETMETPAGRFTNVLKIQETTPLEPGEKAAKFYAAGIGLLKDGSMKLVRHGVVKR